MSSAPVPADFYRAEGYSPEESVGYLMRRVILSLATDATKRLEPLGLTHAQWPPLMKLHFGHGSTVVELARELNMDPGAMTRLLDRLEAKGLCRRVRSEVDRRVVNVELTPEGASAAEHIPAALSEVMNCHLAGFTRDEWQTLKGFMNRMLLNGERMRSDGG